MLLRQIGQSRSNHRSTIMEICQKNMTHQLFKVTHSESIWTERLAMVIHSNHGPILYHFWEKWRFWSKIANFLHPMYLSPPLREFPLEFPTHAALTVMLWLGSCLYRKVYRVWQHVHSVRYNTIMWWTDRQMDGQMDDPRVLHGETRH